MSSPVRLCCLTAEILEMALKIPHTTSELGENWFRYYAPYGWNELQHDLKLDARSCERFYFYFIGSVLPIKLVTVLISVCMIGEEIRLLVSWVSWGRLSVLPGHSLHICGNLYYLKCKSTKCCVREAAILPCYRTRSLVCCSSWGYFHFFQLKSFWGVFPSLTWATEP